MEQRQNERRGRQKGRQIAAICGMFMHLPGHRQETIRRQREGVNQPQKCQSVSPAGFVLGLINTGATHTWTIHACVSIERVGKQFFCWTIWRRKLFSILGRWLLLMKHQDEEWFEKRREDDVVRGTITMAMLHNEETEKK